VDVTQIGAQVERESGLLQGVRQQLEKVIIGQGYLLERLQIGLLCNAHLLIEGVPGLAKTLSITTLAQAIDARFRRIQFTPDLLPADLIGTLVYHPGSGEFTTKRGPIFANIILADEINRASPRTQSSLLEAMQEGSVTVEGVTHALPQPFFVIATQNPVTFVGVFHLPEGELDRFGISFSLGYPTDRAEKEILDRFQSDDPLTDLRPVAGAEEIVALRGAVRQVQVDDSIKDYVIALASRTRDNPLLKLGASPRCSQHVLLAAQAFALADGRDFVLPEDVRAMLPVVVPHRLVLSAEARMENLSPAQVVERILQQVPIPTGLA
jgi:MoxR-like ATPase